MKIYVKENPSQPYVDHLIIACANLDLEVGSTSEGAPAQGSARFTVIYENVENTQLNCVNVVLAGEDYEAWGDSDQYVIDFILNKLGFEEKQKDSYDS